MPSDKRIASPLILLAAFVIIIAGLRAAEGIVVPFLLSVCIAVILSPSLRWLQKIHIHKILAIALVVIGFFSIGVLFIALVTTSLNQFYQSLPQYLQQLAQLQADLILWLNSQGFEIPDRVITEYFNPSSAITVVANMLKGLGGILTNTFLIFMTVIFILLETTILPHKLKKLVKNKSLNFPHWSVYTNGIKKYLYIKTLTSFVTGVIVGIFLSIMGIHNPFLWGLIIFFLNYIPNIGAIIAGVPTVILGLAQLGVTEAIIIAIVYTVINVGLGVVEPRFMGKGLGLSTLIVFLSLVFWGWVLGPIGMLLSVPLTLTLKLTFEQHPDTEWISILLGASHDEPFSVEETLLYQDL